MWTIKSLTQNSREQEANTTWNIGHASWYEHVCKIIFQSSMVKTALNIVRPPLINRHQELHDINHYCDDNPHLYFQAFCMRGRENQIMAQIWVVGRWPQDGKGVGGSQRGQEKLGPQSHQQPRTQSLPISAGYLFALWKVREKSYKCFTCPNSTSPLKCQIKSAFRTSG